VILFLHWLGFAAWLGAGMTFMIWGALTKQAPLPVWAHVWETLGKVQQWIVAPACAVATVTGVVLSMQYAQRPGASMGATWLVLMQVLGLLAGVLTLAVATPLANRMAYLALSSVEKGAKDPRAERVRGRLALVSSVSGAMILVTLYFAANHI
jgi:membrane-associated phospholipid phosphatase